MTKILQHQRKVLGSWVFCAPHDRYIRRHIDRHSTDVLVDISMDTWPICPSTYRLTLSWYISTEICRSTYRPTYRSSVANMLTNTRQICQSICWTTPFHTTTIKRTMPVKARYHNSYGSVKKLLKCEFTFLDFFILIILLNACITTHKF